jgi:hypothetical protein
MVTSAYFRSCLVLMADLTVSSIPHDWLVTWNESLITRARNEMTAAFLKTEWSHMMWIDSDIEFTTDEVIKLWNMNADIAVGVYAMKKPDKQYFAAWKDGVLIKDLDQFGSKPIEVDYAGTGFMLIKRGVIESLIKSCEFYQGPDGEVPALYMTPVHNGGFESEDYNFCRKAREAGFKLMMEPTVRLKHWGGYPYGA